MCAKDANTGTPDIGNTLQNIVVANLQSKENLKQTSDPEIELKDLIEYQSRMKIFGQSKFNKPCCGSAISFYKTDAQKETDDACGGIVVYIEQSNAGKLFRMLGQNAKEDSDEEMLMDASAEYLKIITNEFISKISSSFGTSLIVGDPVTFMNELSDGISFDYNEYNYYELGFHLFKTKVLAFDVCLGKL